MAKTKLCGVLAIPGVVGLTLLHSEWPKLNSGVLAIPGVVGLTLLHSERPKLHRVLAVLSAGGLGKGWGKRKLLVKNHHKQNVASVLCWQRLELYL